MAKKNSFEPEFKLKINSYIIIPPGTYKTHYGSFDVKDTMFGKIHDFQAHNRVHLKYLVETTAKYKGKPVYVSFGKDALEAKAIVVGWKARKAFKILFGDS